MRSSVKKVSVVLLLASLLFSESAFAARIGKSRNSGMQRSVNTTNTTNNVNTAGAAGSTGAAQAQPQRNGVGAGTVVAGAAAGAIGGYMLGKAMSNNNESQSAAANQNQGSQIPWGMIAILGALLAIGLMMFRRRAGTPAYPGQSINQPNQQNQNNSNFEIPQMRNSNGTYTPGQYTSGGNGQNNPQQAEQVPTRPQIEKLPDGVEAQYFLRQAKGMFLHIQSMNTPDNVHEVEKYMTSDLYNDIKSSITENDYVADFSQLDCSLLDATTEDATYIASVLFFGKVSESPSSPVVDYKEIWHFTKPANSVNGKWIVSGIQQENIV
ncbi:MAG: Tim44-like domain-containing protein [Burkholderiales bacterium]|nr:Tim44-like domain-containing protein [Burkholderiales bacterium]